MCLCSLRALCEPAALIPPLEVPDTVLESIPSPSEDALLRNSKLDSFSISENVLERSPDNAKDTSGDAVG